MSAPFYVSPEQIMADKAEFSRKGIARGKSIIAAEYAEGILLVAENSTSLSKIGEIYDRIAFAGVGKFSEFDQLRKGGVRYADTKGYAYSREDVGGKALANEYSRVIGEAFTRDPKPLEIEIIVAEVGDDRWDDHRSNRLYRVTFDGFISEHSHFCVIGGKVDDVESVISGEYEEGMPVANILRLGIRALEGGTDRAASLDESNLEVSVMRSATSGRKFERLSSDQIRDALND